MVGPLVEKLFFAASPSNNILTKFQVFDRYLHNTAVSKHHYARPLDRMYVSGTLEAQLLNL